MLNWSPNAVKSWVVVGVGALVLALSAFFILSNFSPDSTYAQMVPASITYNENGTGPVITLTSMDPESRGVTWSLMGTDAADFTIAGGVLEFKNPPDFENATDREHTAIDIDGDEAQTGPGEEADAADNNMYQIIIMVTEGRQSGDAGVAKYTKIGATVSVMEVNEPGTLTLDALQPQVGRAIMVDRMDEDADTGTINRQWARSKVQTPIITSTAHWEDLDGATNPSYTPVEADEDEFLRVTETYTDTAASANNTARVVTMYRVRAMPENNGSPDFPAEEHTRSVLETAKVGDPVGVNMPVAATAADAVDVGKLIYGLVEVSDNSGDDDYFDIDQYTGQITVAQALDADTVGGRTYADVEAGKYVVSVTVSDPSTTVASPDDTVMVTITATQQNENPTVIWEDNDTDHPNETDINGILEISIEENTNIAAGNVYGAADVDANPNINWQPNLGGDDGSLFSLSGTSTRTLTFNDMPDYEMPEDMNGDNVYEVTLVVTDGQGGQGMLPIKVTVTDADEVEDAEVTLSSDQPHLDSPLKATLMVPDGDMTIIGWKWYRAPSAADFADQARTDVTEIPGATSDTYTPTAEDNGIGNFLEAQVRFIHKHSSNLPMPGEALGDQDGDVQTASKVSTHAILAALGTSMDPVFPASTLTREVQENAEPGDRVGPPVLAVDADSIDMLAYELGGPAMRFFEFAADSPGQIIISDGEPTATQDAPMLNREDSNRRRFIVTVKAMDGDGNSTTATVNINVTDVNEGPEFMNAPDAETNYDEKGTGTVITLRATDPEGRGVDWEVTGTDAADFTISGGALRFKNSPSYENATNRAHTPADLNGDGDTDDPGEPSSTAGDNNYKIIVRATEKRASGYTGPALSTSIGVTVAVQDLNEAGTITLNALQPQVGRLITATPRDGDGTPNVDDWEWRRSSVEGPSIDDDNHWESITTGATAVSYNPTDDDLGKYLRVVATYDDSTVDAPDNANVVRMVTRYKVREALENNGSPDFPAGDHTRSVSETADVGDPVGVNMPVTATEHDAEDRGKLIYGLIANTTNTDDDDYFNINQYTGQITVAQALDADGDQGRAGNPDNGEYVVVVTVADPAAVLPTTTTGLVNQDTVEVTITATQENENPTITGESQYTIEENDNLPTTPQEASTYMAADVDPDSNINWEKEGDDKDLLRISGTGDRMLAFIDEPDYEMPGDANGDNVYEVSVVVTDGDGGRRAHPVRIVVTNVEEDAEVMLSSEQPHLGEPITATLEDDDIPRIEDVVVAWQWSRSLSSSADDTDFVDIAGATSETYIPRSRYADGVDTGEELDNDTGYFLRAEATYSDGAGVADTDDMESGRSGAAVLSTPSVNTAPEFPRAAETRMVNENAPATTAVGDPVVANDADNEMLEYTMSGADASSFEINEESGQITVGMGTMLDYEGTKKPYNVMVTVEDAAGATDSVTVTINVEDMNEMPTTPMQSFGMTITGPSAPEYEEDGMDAIGPYGTQGETGTVTWMALAGDDAGDFTFNRSNGHLMFASTPDFEMPGDMNEDNVYEVTLSATAGLDSDELDVIVTVTNKDEMGRVTFWRDGADATEAAIMVGDMLTGLAEDMDGNPMDTPPLSGMYTQITGATWQWSKSMDMNTWMVIDGADMAAYEVMSDNAGYYLRAMAMYTDGDGSGKSAMATTTGMVTGTVTVTPGDPLLAEYDPDGDGVIEKADMRRAVTGFFDTPPTLTRPEMRRLVSIYFQ